MADEVYDGAIGIDLGMLLGPRTCLRSEVLWGIVEANKNILTGTTYSCGMFKPNQKRRYQSIPIQNILVHFELVDDMLIFDLQLPTMRVPTSRSLPTSRVASHSILRFLHRQGAFDWWVCKESGCYEPKKHHLRYQVSSPSTLKSAARILITTARRLIGRRFDDPTVKKEYVSLFIPRLLQIAPRANGWTPRFLKPPVALARIYHAWWIQLTLSPVSSHGHSRSLTKTEALLSRSSTWVRRRLSHRKRSHPWFWLR